jgi:hypothetical protein
MTYIKAFVLVVQMRHITHARDDILLARHYTRSHFPTSLEDIITLLFLGPPPPFMGLNTFLGMGGLSNYDVVPSLTLNSLHSPCVATPKYFAKLVGRNLLYLAILEWTYAWTSRTFFVVNAWITFFLVCMLLIHCFSLVKFQHMVSKWGRKYITDQFSGNGTLCTRTGVT